MFEEYEIEITTKGKCHRGAVIGNEEFKNEYIEEKIKEWIEDLKILASIAKSELQSAYLAMTFAVQHQRKFVQRTVPNISENFRKIEHEIHQTLLSAIIGRDISTEERDILALPVRFGGLGIPKPNKMSNLEYEASLKIAHVLKAFRILMHNPIVLKLLFQKKKSKHERKIF